MRGLGDEVPAQAVAEQDDLVSRDLSASRCVVDDRGEYQFGAAIGREAGGTQRLKGEGLGVEQKPHGNGMSSTERRRASGRTRIASGSTPSRRQTEHGRVKLTARADTELRKIRRRWYAIVLCEM